MTQYETLGELEDLIDNLIKGEKFARFNDEGLKTLNMVKELLAKYNEINEKREI